MIQNMILQNRVGSVTDLGRDVGKITAHLEPGLGRQVHKNTTAELLVRVNDYYCGAHKTLAINVWGSMLQRNREYMAEECAGLDAAAAVNRHACAADVSAAHRDMEDMFCSGLCTSTASTAASGPSDLSDGDSPPTPDGDPSIDSQ